MAFVRNPVVYVPDLTNGRPIVDGKVYILTAGTVPPMHDSAIDPLDLVTVSYYNEANNLVTQPQPLYTSKGGCLYGNYPDAARQFIISPQAYVFAVYNRIGQLEYSAETTASDYVETNALADANSTVLIGGVEAQRVAKGLQLISPKSWGILANGTDETAKWQSLITYCATNKFGIGSFTGSTLITSQLVFPSGFGGIIGDSQLNMVFVKGFNGDMFSLNSQGMVLQNFWIQGVGGTYTGGGVRVVSDNIIIEHMRITDTADSTIICNANAAKFLDVEDCHLYTIDSVNIPAIRGSGVDISTSPTVRKFDKISGSFYLLDSSGMNEYTVCNSLFSKLNFDANCSKGKFYGNRITAASNNINVLGDSNVFFGNIIAMGAANDLTIDGNNTYFDDSNVYVKGTNTKASPLINATYGGAVTHSVTTKLVDVSSSLVIKGTTTDWTRGNSTVTAYYRLADQLCYYTFTVIRGSTATNATGTWSVTLPFKALVGSQGSVLIKSSTGTYYAAILQVVGGGNSATLWIDTLTASMSDTSISFGTGGILQGTIQYLVASS